MIPKIYKVAENAYFVQSYSEQTMLLAYETGTTIQFLGPGNDIIESTEPEDMIDTLRDQPDDQLTDDVPAPRTF